MQKIKKTISLTVLSFLLVLTPIDVVASDDLHENHTGWKAGVARVVITPEHSMWLAGYAKRDRPSEGIPLHGTGTDLFAEWRSPVSG